MFSSCKTITSLDLSSFNTSKVTEMNEMFRNCSALQMIYVGDGWKTDMALAVWHVVAAAITKPEVAECRSATTMSRGKRIIILGCASPSSFVLCNCHLTKGLVHDPNNVNKAAKFAALFLLCFICNCKHAHDLVLINHSNRIQILPR